MRKLFFIMIVLAGLVSCDKESQSEIDEQLIQQYIAENDIDATRQSTGMYYEIIRTGDTSNKPNTSSVVNIRYKGYLTDGTIFDDSKGSIRSWPLSGLIKGWQYGIPLIGKGGKIKLIIPSTLGYGSTASGDIPANSILVFEVELVNYQ